MRSVVPRRQSVKRNLTLPIGRVTLLLVRRSELLAPLGPDRLRTAPAGPAPPRRARSSGQDPPPLVRVTARAVARRSGSAHAHAPRPMRVARVVRETVDAGTVVLEHPGGEPVVFAAGQFFTLHVRLAGRGARQARVLGVEQPARPVARRGHRQARRRAGACRPTSSSALREGDVVDVLGPSGSLHARRRPAGPAASSSWEEAAGSPRSSPSRARFSRPSPAPASFSSTATGRADGRHPPRCAGGPRA